MAECTVVHFASATWEVLSSWLDTLAARVESRRWNYPDPYEPLLFVYEYDDLLREYEPADLARLQELLPGGQSATMCLQLRRRHGDASVGAAADFTVQALRAFPGVAHDTYAEFWSLIEIETGASKSYGRFLDCYRSWFDGGGW